MITAKFVYTNNTELNKNGYSHLEFDGDKNILKKLTNLQNLLIYDKLNLAKEEIDCLNICKDRNKEEISTYTEEIDKIKKQNKVLLLNRSAYNRVKVLRENVDALTFDNHKIDIAISGLEEDSYYEVEELIEKYHKMLKKLGFECADSRGADDVAMYEDYKSTLSDEVLEQTIDLEIKKLETKINEEIAKIHKNYGMVNISKQEEGQDMI